MCNLKTHHKPPRYNPKVGSKKALAHRPYRWSTMQDVAGGINPAFLIFPNASDGNKLVYSLWLKGKIHVADSASGPSSPLDWQS